MYVTRRRNRVLRKGHPTPLDPAKSNPSKRHRERLNGELEYLASLLPYEDSVIARLDKLSILRLAVSYIRAKTYYRAISHTPLQQPIYQDFADVDGQLKALNGFILVVDPHNEVFYVSKNAEQFLGFHQSDILHQCVLELVHSEDRDNFSEQLNWSNLLMHLGPKPSTADTNRLQALGAESHNLLQRSFIVRFRCLLDNTSGFITMEICGHLKPLYGQVGLEGLSLFAVCSPFGSVPLGDTNMEDVTFRSKLKLDMTIVNVDKRGKLLLGDAENLSMYHLLHPLDLRYFTEAHKELIKAGSFGLVAYRIVNKDGGSLWLQTSARIVYRNNKPDYVMCFHRNLTEEEGTNLVNKRNIELAMPHLHLDTLGEDSECGDDPPRTPKGRKAKKSSTSSQVGVAEPLMQEMLGQAGTHKDHPMYYSFHGFPTAMHQYASPSNSQLHDGFNVDNSNTRPICPNPPVDYLSYSNHLQMALDADRLAAVARIHQPNPGCTPYTHSYSYNLTDTQHDSFNTTSRYCLPSHTQNSMFVTDVNANSLISFRDVAYPLLNQ